MQISIRSLLIIVLALSLMLPACVAPPAPDSPAVKQPIALTVPLPLACQTAADCEVKNVGNCCGYYPACVHKDQSVDPEAVQTRCTAEGKSSICGFPEISACACVESRCVNSGIGNSGGDPRLP